MKITNDIITDYLDCKHKAYLSVSNVAGRTSDYEKLLKQQELQYIRGAISVRLGQGRHSHPIHNTPITLAVLEKGADIIPNVLLTTESMEIAVHCIKRVPGPSSLGPFHYEPVLFSCLGRTSHQSHRIILAMACIALEQVQNFRPQHGAVISGAGYKPHRIHLNKELAKVEPVIGELKELLAGGARPPLRINVHCRVCRYQSICKAEAQRTDDLSLLSRITESEVKSYHRKGISTIRQLSYTFRFRKRGKRVKAQGRPHSFPLQALAIREQSVFVVSKPELPKGSARIYVGMEGDPSGSFVYLIGVLTVEDGISSYQGFWANTEADEKQLLECFWKFLTGMKNAHVFYYGTYEARVFRRIIRQFGSGQANETLTASSINVLSLIYANVYFPTYSNELKDIASHLGFEWATPGTTGLDAIIWRAQWECNRDSSIKDRLLVYNKDDCLALQCVTDFLTSVPETNSGYEANHGGLRFVSQIGSADYVGKFGKKASAITEFAEITERAYFDYQRDKIYIRTNKRFKHIQRRKRRNQRRASSLRPNKYVTLKARVCPQCKSSHITRDVVKYHNRVSLDLRFLPSGVRRWIVHYRAPFHFCNDCTKTFVPPVFRKRSRFGHGLISWAMDQHIGNRITFQNLERTVRDHFSLPVRYSQFYNLKVYAGEYYAKTYDRILRNLIRGDIIHVDETKIDLQSGSGYVWVFTSMEEVFYLYRGGREAHFLHDLLSEFNGVLISDFYSGYDSLPCRQQKCLLHLIRDVNNDLLRNPFDQELKGMASRFGRLIRRIVGTVDRFGLSSQHLGRHKNEVQEFIGLLDSSSFTSDAAEKYSKRILKYQAKLFTFMDFNGVPWNNNNAEHSIKPFAKYRRLIDGQITENGLRPYLVLLSIYQTCKYKEISFLDFMLSGKRDMDAFIAQR